MSIEHDYFGLIGDYWSEQVQYGDQDVEVVLDADADLVSLASLDAAATMVGELELVDDEVRSHFVSQLDSGSSPVSRFLRSLLEGEGDDQDAAAEAISRDSGDRDIDALRSLTLVRVDLRPDADGEGEHFAELEYGLAPEEVDARLVAVIDVGRDVVDVRFDA
ncbi:DUF2004 domain-containing protein [Agromyces tardus]|jgi:hypothetical protein|uniref:DUF2004 domain-containing protein n=1 Tax=Agromyces tardus TaxID=2583849 RepID=A0A3M8A302_9MICO|nr:DUF2004 domain-containing protein [Agromyces tardus]RNB45462.1 DUF2004 domain-containing protein [Agromyces tardus]